MRRTIIAAAALAAAVTAGGAALAASGGAATGSGSRLDDGKDLLPQAEITEQRAIEAAQTAATGALNEVDLEHLHGRLVFNVDVGNHDVKVDATTAKVVRVDQDD